MKNFLEKVQKKGPAGRKRSDRKGNRTRQKNKRGDSKVKSNDSPEIPDKGETSDIPGLPSGVVSKKQSLKDKQTLSKKNKKTTTELSDFRSLHPGYVYRLHFYTPFYTRIYHVTKHHRSLGLKASDISALIEQ